jgi:hypothetical protein
MPWSPRPYRRTMRHQSTPLQVQRSWTTDLPDSRTSQTGRPAIPRPLQAAGLCWFNSGCIIALFRTVSKLIDERLRSECAISRTSIRPIGADGRSCLHVFTTICRIIARPNTRHGPICIFHVAVYLLQTACPRYSLLRQQLE